MKNNFCIDQHVQGAALSHPYGVQLGVSLILAQMEGFALELV